MNTNKLRPMILMLPMIAGCHWISGNVSSTTVGAVSENISATTSYCLGDRLTNSPFAGGSGTSSDPYTICTATQFNTIGSSSSYSAFSYKLMADIDLSSYSAATFNSPGTVTGFTGQFNGNNKTISNLTFLNPSGGTTAGMFRTIGAGGSVSNLTLSNIIVRRNGGYIGLLSGSCNSGTISNVTISGVELRATGASGQIGGLVGYSNGCTISTISSSVGNATFFL